MFEHESHDTETTREDEFTHRERRYRELQAQAVQYAQQFDGSENAYETLSAHLKTWEDFVREQGFSGDIADQETEAALRFNPENPQDIEATIDIAVRSLTHRIEETLKHKDHAFVIERTAGMFLRPKDSPERTSITLGSGTFEIHFDDIVEQFIRLLKESDLFTDDIIATECDPPEPNMIRQESYIKIEIPRLGRTVLLCNQLKEGTYVIHGVIPNDILTTYSKEDLANSKIFDAKLVPRGPMWREHMITLLTQEDGWIHAIRERSKKYDVKEIVRIRAEFIQTVTSRFTPQQWLDMDWDTFGHLQLIDGYTMHSLRAPLGMGDYIRYKEIRILLGIWVWPDHEGLQQAYVKAREHYEDQLLRRERTTDDWRALIQAAITPKQWIALTPNQALNLTIPGTTAKLTAIGGAFGVSGVIGNFLQRLLLGQKIFPESEEIKKEIEIEQRTANAWYDVLRANLAPQQWLNVKNDDSLWKIRIDGRTLPAIAKICGIEHNIRGRIVARLQFAAHIWPEHLQIREALQNAAMDREDWIHAIRETYTPERWFTGSYPDLTVRNKKFGAIVRGIFADTMRHNDAARLAIARLVWPDDPVVRTATERAERTREGWIALIQSRFTPKTWQALNAGKTDQIKIDELGLTAIANKLGFPEFKFSSREAHDKLGTIIWPGEYTNKERR